MSTTPRTSASQCIFLSYGRLDAKELAVRLRDDLTTRGYRVWLDEGEIRAGRSWEEQIEQAVLSSDLFVALLTPHAVRRPDGVCLDEISLARYSRRKIVPAMVIPCRPPLGIYRLDWVDFQHWQLPAEYERALERLLEAIAQPSEMVEGACARVFAKLRPQDFGAEISRLTRDFIGRKWLERELQRWLEEEGDGRVFFVTGDPGAGKSAVLARLIEKHPQVVAYHFCVASLSETLDPPRFVTSIAAQLATQLVGYRAALDAVDLEDTGDADAGMLLRRLVAEPLRAEKPERPMLIVVDGLDEALERGGRTIPQVLRERLDDLPPWVRLVLSSRKLPAVLDSFSRFRPHEIDAASPENLGDIERYLDAKLRQSPTVLAALRDGAERKGIVEAICRKGEGNFLYVVQVMAAIEAGRLDVHRPEAFPDGLVGIYQSFFERLFPTSQEYEGARALLEVIVAGRESLSAEQIATFADRDVFEVERNLEKVAAFFPLRGGKYHTYHKSIIDWLGGGAGQSRVYRLDLRSAHRRIAAKLLANYQTDSAEVFLLAHLPAHLIAARQWAELEDLLTDLQFLQAKASAGMVTMLADDLREAVKALPADRPNQRVLRVIEEALGMDLGFISRHPGALFQCLWNRCWWYDSLDASKHFAPPAGGWPVEGPTWMRPGPKIHELAEQWRAAKERREPGFIWLRSRRPLPTQPASGILCVLRPGGGADPRPDTPVGDHFPALNSVFLSPDGRLVACTLKTSFHAVARVLVFDVDDGRLLTSIAASAKHLAFSPDGRWLVTGSAFSEDAARVWEIASGREIAKLGRGAFHTVAFSPDGHRIVAVSEHELQVWEVPTLAGKSAQLAWSRPHSRKHDWLKRATWTRVAFSPDGAQLVVDREVLDATSARHLISLGGSEGIRCACFSPKGERLALAYDDNTLQVWETASGQSLAGATVRSVAEHLAFSADGQRIFSAGAEGEPVLAWAPDLVGASAMSVVVPSWDPGRLAFSGDGQRIAVAPRLTGGGEIVQVYRLVEGAQRPGQLAAHSSMVLWSAFLEAGRRMLSVSGRDARLWNTATAEPEAHYPLARGVTQKQFALSADARFLAYRTGMSDEQVSAVAWAMGQGVSWEDLQGTNELPEVVGIDLTSGDTCRISKDGDKVVFPDGQEAPLVSKPELTGAVAPARPQWRAQKTGSETVIHAADTDRAVAWFPAPLDELTPHPSGRTWTGSEGNDVYLLTLEGGPEDA